MDTPAVTLQTIRQHPAVAHARCSKGQITIDIRGTLSCEGERNSRVSLINGRLRITRGSGRTSLLWENNLAALTEWLASSGVVAEVRRRAA